MSLPIIAGNWKMYKTIEEAKTFVETLASLQIKSQAAVYLAVPFTAIAEVASQVATLGSPFLIGAQNMNDASEGAFTGEIAARMLKEAGARFVILGHSERRQLFNETNEFINKKVKRAIEEGLQPILCVGETGDQRREGKTQSVLEDQLLGSLKGVRKLRNLVIAYEPVWAIGTGQVAEPSDAQQAHTFIRGIVREKWGEEAAGQLPILYGGSVKPENAKILLDQPDVNGLLVGGSSLSAEAFHKIIMTEKQP